MNCLRLLYLAFFISLIGCAPADPQQNFSSSNTFAVPRISNQVVLGITDSWNSSHVTLQLFDRNGSQWQASSQLWSGRLGKNGSSWGIGAHPKQGGKQKVEGDGRTPAGVFYIGGVWGYAESCEKHPNTPYRQITSRDLWYENKLSPYYNQHKVLPYEPKSTAEKKAQMRQGDAAHSLKMFVAHNPPPNAQPGRGSAIFFHIWRGGGSKTTAGCTTMAESKLRSLISQINPDKTPTYVILPRQEYNRLKAEWQLP